MASRDGGPLKETDLTEHPYWRNTLEGDSSESGDPWEDGGAPSVPS